MNRAFAPSCVADRPAQRFKPLPNPSQRILIHVQAINRSQPAAWPTSQCAAAAAVQRRRQRRRQQRLEALHAEAPMEGTLVGLLEEPVV